MDKHSLSRKFLRTCALRDALRIRKYSDGEMIYVLVEGHTCWSTLLLFDKLKFWFLLTRFSVLILISQTAPSSTFEWSRICYKCHWLCTSIFFSNLTVSELIFEVYITWETGKKQVLKFRCFTVCFCVLIFEVLNVFVWKFYGFEKRRKNKDNLEFWKR